MKFSDNYILEKLYISIYSENSGESYDSKKYNDKGKLIYQKQGEHEYFFDDEGRIIRYKNKNGSEKIYEKGSLVYQKDSKGNISEYKDGQLIYTKDAETGAERKYKDGQLIYYKPRNGTAIELTEEIDDLGNVIKKWPDGKVTKHNKNNKLLYSKEIEDYTTYETWFDENGNIIHTKNEDYSGDWVENWFYNTELGNITRTKESNGDESEYNSSTGKYIYKKQGGELIYYDEDGLAISKKRKIAEKKAENYMRDYHGLFLHSLYPSQLNQLLSLKDSHHEVCISTVRSSTVFRPETDSIVLIGFGNIRELYDFDAYSEMSDSGKRYSTKSNQILQTPELHSIRRAENLKSHHGEFNENDYYDEGFMPWNSAEVLIASVPDIPERIESQLSWYTSDHISRSEIIERLKEVYPNIKIISSKEFSRLKNSEELLTITYNAQQELKDKEIMSRPFHKYEENKKITFKNYFILENKVQIPLEIAYDIFKKEYDKSTGTSWDRNKFMNRASNWEFYGDNNGYVAIRRQRSGFVKLVGMAGNNKSKLKGIQDLISMNLPLWGLVSKDIKDIAVRKGMREPNILERQVLKRSIPAEVLGGAEILNYQNDGGIELKYPDVGTTIKYMVGTPLYYSELRKRFKDKILR